MPKGPRKFHFLFENKGLTRFGGLSLFQLFCRRFAIRRFLQTAVRWPDYDYRQYHPADIFMAHVFCVVAGIGRMENTQCLIHNGLIPPLLGFHDFPHRDTMREFLRRFGPKELSQLEAAHNRLRRELFDRLKLQYSAIVDADTTTLLTYGAQEGVARGYIRKQHHRYGSYAPILSSEGRTGLSLGIQLRAGNVHAGQGTPEFLSGILQKLPSTIAVTRIRIRLDGAFYDKAIIEPLEQARFGYAVVASMTAPLKSRMLGAKYTEFARGWESAEFTYTPFNWKKEHRYVVIRRPAALESPEAQRNLFTYRRYTYRRALVTNLELTPAAVWRFYCDRGFQELLLREFKNSYAMTKIPTRSFWANAAYMEMVLWAYDLVLAFQNLCLPQEVRHWNISTLRRELWWLPAEWVRTARRNLLRLPATYPRQNLFVQIERATNRIKPLI
jgi:hypothetical protein